MIPFLHNFISPTRQLLPAKPIPEGLVIVKNVNHKLIVFIHTDLFNMVQNATQNISTSSTICKENISQASRLLTKKNAAYNDMKT